MEKEYEKSLQRIKEMKGFISIKEWNEIAKKENLLSTESLKYISRKNFKDLCREIRR